MSFQIKCLQMYAAQGPRQSLIHYYQPFHILKLPRFKKTPASEFLTEKILSVSVALPAAYYSIFMRCNLLLSPHSFIHCSFPRLFSVSFFSDKFLHIQANASRLCLHSVIDVGRAAAIMTRLSCATLGCV